MVHQCVCVRVCVRVYVCVCVCMSVGVCVLCLLKDATVMCFTVSSGVNIAMTIPMVIC